MPIITTDRETEIILTATPGQTVFSFDFEIFEAGDVDVMVDGDDPPPFTVTGMGDLGGGEVTFDDAMLGGERVTLVRVVPGVNTLDLPSTGPYSTDNIDAEFDRVFAILQQQRTIHGRTLRAPPGEAVQEIPAAADRAGHVLGFDSTGLIPLAVVNTAVALAEDLAAAQAAADAALVSQIASADSAGEAEVFADEAEGFMEAAESHANQAGLYLAAFPMAAPEPYGDEPTGRAAVADGQSFWVLTAGVLILYRRINAGTVSTVLFQSGGITTQAVIHCNTGGTAQAITVTPKTGYAFNGTDQMIVTNIAAGNSSAGVTLRDTTGVINAGVAADLLMPNGDQIPLGQLVANHRLVAFWSSGLSKFLLVAPATPRSSVIMCNQTGGTGNNVIATIAHGGSKYRADLFDTEFKVRMTATAGLGGKTLKILKPDGSTLITDTNVHLKDDVTVPPARCWETDDTVPFRRLSSGFFIIADGPSSAVRTVSTTYPQLDDLGQRMSDVRPLAYTKRGDEHHIIDMRFHEDKYLNGEALNRRMSDMIRVVGHDMASFSAVTGNSFSLNSWMTRVRGGSQHDLNMQFTDLISGITTDTGRVPTTIEPPIVGGKFGDAAALYVIAGNGHGEFDEPTSLITLTYADASTGEVDTDVVIDPAADIGFRQTGDSLVVDVRMLCTNVANDVWCVQSHTMTFDPIATDQLHIESEYDFTDADVTVTPGFMRGFGMLFAASDIDRCQPIVNGVPQAVIVIDTRDDTDIPIGYPEQVVFWHSDFPQKQIIVTNNFGYGFTHAENGVPVANGAHQSYITNGSAHTKLYGALYGDHGLVPTLRNMTGIIVTQDYSIRWVLDDERT